MYCLNIGFKFQIFPMYHRNIGFKFQILPLYRRNICFMQQIFVILPKFLNCQSLIHSNQILIIRLLCCISIRISFYFLLPIFLKCRLFIRTISNIIPNFCQHWHYVGNLGILAKYFANVSLRVGQPEEEISYAKKIFFF